MKVAQENVIPENGIKIACGTMNSLTNVKSSSSSSTSLTTSNSKSSKYSSDTFDLTLESSVSNLTVSNGCQYDVLKSCFISLENLGKELSQFEHSGSNKNDLENLKYMFDHHAQEIEALHAFILELQNQMTTLTQSYRLSKKSYRELEVQHEMQTKKLSELFKRLEAFDDLKGVLESTTHQLKLKECECHRLLENQKSMDGEMQELSASLFEEAHKMVNEANVKQANAEKALKESRLQIDVLQAEVKALKDMVLTSTPSQPNKHLHPHLEHKKTGKSFLTFLDVNSQKSKSTSLPRILYGREDSCESIPSSQHKRAQSENFEVDQGEFDPVLHTEFSKWHEKPCLEKSAEFMSRIYLEDIIPALEFPNGELGKLLLQAIETDSVFIEKLNAGSLFKNCSLLMVPRLVCYNLRLDSTDLTYQISNLCRNRITAVINLLNYLKYIKVGLVKVIDNKTFWDVMRLRKEVHSARLGLSCQ